MHVVRLEPLAPLEERELDQERRADDDASELLDELALRPRGAAGGEQIVVHEHPRPARERVDVHLERVDPVLERVLGADRRVRELPRLAGRHESDAHAVGERRAEHEAARLGAEDDVRPARLGPGGELLDGLVQRLRDREQRHDVLEDDPGLRVVANVADVGGKVDGHGVRLLVGNRRR